MYSDFLEIQMSISQWIVMWMASGGGLLYELYVK